MGQFNIIYSIPFLNTKVNCIKGEQVNCHYIFVTSAFDQQQQHETEKYGPIKCIRSFNSFKQFHSIHSTSFIQFQSIHSICSIMSFQFLNLLNTIIRHHSIHSICLFVSFVQFIQFLSFNIIIHFIHSFVQVLRLIHVQTETLIINNASVPCS